MMLTLIAAMTDQHVIGQDNRLPWHMPADLRHFKALTLHKVVVMGSKTYASIGKPLPNRTNIILTRQADFQAEGCEVVHSLAELFARFGNSPELMIIGGSEIFRQCMPLASKMYLTLIHAVIPGNIYFPRWPDYEWRELCREDHAADAANPHDYSFLTFERVAE